jgi:hypothetical protein
MRVVLVVTLLSRKALRTALRSALRTATHGWQRAWPRRVAPNEMFGPYRRIEGFRAEDRFGTDLTYLLDPAGHEHLVLLGGERTDWRKLDSDTARLRAPGHPARVIVTS